MLEKLTTDFNTGDAVWKQIYIKLDSFGGFIFVNSPLFEPYKAKPLVEQYGMICTCLNHMDTDIYRPFQDKLNQDDYDVYKFRKYELYINKNNLKSVEYINGGYEFQFIWDDYWYIKCDKEEIEL
jgi:hypothetical protein